MLGMHSSFVHNDFRFNLAPYMPLGYLDIDLDIEYSLQTLPGASLSSFSSVICCKEMTDSKNFSGRQSTPNFYLDFGISSFRTFSNNSSIPTLEITISSEDASGG